MTQLDVLRSFDRINLSSTFFQATIVVAFAAAHLGATRHFRRPAMRALAGFWSLFALAAIVNIGSSWSGAIWRSRELSLALTTLVVALSAASIPYACASAHAMAGATEDATTGATHRRHALRWLSAVLLLHAVGVFGFLARWPTHPISWVGWSRGLALAVAVIPAWGVWQVYRTSRANRPALLLLTLGLSALALRQAVSFVLGLRVGRPDLPFLMEVAAISAEVLTIMAMGALSLLATTAEELSFEQDQAAALNAAQARLAAGERMESLGRLAAGVAHDFNNILQVVMLAAADLRGSGGGANVSEIDSATDHGRRLVRQLMDFARPPQRGAGAGSTAACDAAARLMGIAAILQSLMQRGTALRVAAADAPARIAVEPAAFEQVVINLVTNARDAMSAPGTVDVRLDLVTVSGSRTTGPDLDAGAYVRLTVADTGDGIAPDLLVRIFEPFFTTKPTDRGTGLGLSTVHGIAHGAGGGVGVTSTVGVGTTFEVYFPAVAA